MKIVPQKLPVWIVADLVYSLVDLFQTQKLNAVDLLFAEKLSLLHQVWEPMFGLTLDILQFDLD